MQAFAALLMHQFEWSACGKADAQGQEEVRGGGRDSQGRPLPVSLALTLLICGAKGLLSMSSPPPGEENGVTLGGQRREARAPQRGEMQKGAGPRPRPSSVHSCAGG